VTPAESGYLLECWLQIDAPEGCSSRGHWRSAFSGIHRTASNEGSTLSAAGSCFDRCRAGGSEASGSLSGVARSYAWCGAAGDAAQCAWTQIC
jgi:hypothetical protein